MPDQQQPGFDCGKRSAIDSLSVFIGVGLFFAILALIAAFTGKACV